MSTKKPLHSFDDPDGSHVDIASHPQHSKTKCFCVIGSLTSLLIFGIVLLIVLVFHGNIVQPSNHTEVLFLDEEASLPDAQKQTSSQIEGILQRLRQLEGKHEQLQGKHTQLGKNHTLLDQKHTELQENYINLENEHTRFEEKDRELQEKYGQLEAKQNELGGEHLLNFEREHRQLEEKVKVIEEQLDKDETEREPGENHNHAGLEEDIRQLDTKYGQLQQQLSTLSNAAHSQKEQLESLSTSFDSFVKEVASVSSVLSGRVAGLQGNVTANALALQQAISSVMQAESKLVNFAAHHHSVNQSLQDMDKRKIDVGSCELRVITSRTYASAATAEYSQHLLPEESVVLAVTCGVENAKSAIFVKPTESSYRCTCWDIVDRVKEMVCVMYIWFCVQ